MKARLLLMMMALGSWGCGAYEDCDGEIPDADQDVAISVETDSGVPVFLWDQGDAYAMSVWLTSDEGRNDVWHIQCAEGDSIETAACIPSPHTYGDAPPANADAADVSATSGPELTSGESYTVSIATHAASDDDSCSISHSGEATFEAP